MIKSLKKININFFLGLGLLLIIFIVSYFNRWIFTYKFDPIYWENAYYESQWNVPNSPRGIGDEGVYRYIGYRLVHNGENPFNVDYWVPPLGKYTYGISAKFFHNPYLTTFFYYLGSIIIFYLIAKHFFSSPYSFLVTYLFAANPMIVAEIKTTMLDLPLTFFFLLFLYFFLKFLSSKNKYILYLSGISLGLMAGIKPPFFIPMFALITIFFLFKKKNIKQIPLFCFFVFTGYVLSYFCYFIKHPNPIPWVRLHEKVINFQKNNGGSNDWFNILRYIFTREYKGYWINAKSYWPNNWSIILPIGIFSSLYYFFKFIKKQKIKDYLLFSVLIVLCYVSMNFIIDFWPRYLVPMIHLLILISSYLFKKYKIINILILISYSFFLFQIFFPKPTEFWQSFQDLYKNNFYKDTYQKLSLTTKQKMNLNQWQEFSQNNKLSQEKFKLIKENNQWRVFVKKNK